jgi:hypothetical protein
VHEDWKLIGVEQPEVSTWAAGPGAVGEKMELTAEVRPVEEATN